VRRRGALMDTRTQLAIEVDVLRREIAALRREARTDVLTGVGNRRFADERLSQERDAARPCSLILIDIDFFKRVNDEHGHHVGDVVLQAVAGVLASNVRTSDDVCRFGGEEFLVICPSAREHEAVELAERLCAGIGSTVIAQLGRPVTISAGVAEAAPEAFEEALKHADTALYAAKHAGRNCVRAQISRQLVA
jgi:diguanylate cyclase (GGDEF)-like protein